MGWLDGALRLMPAWELRVFGFTIPNPFFPGVLLPAIAFGLLYAWPFLEARVTGDRGTHHLLDRPRDVPLRTAIGCATFVFFGVLFLAGSNDVLSGLVGVAPETLTNVFRIAVFLVPALTFVVARKLCRDLRDSGLHPIRGMPSHQIDRDPAGHFVEDEELDTDDLDTGAVSPSPPRGHTPRPRSTTPPPPDT